MTNTDWVARLKQIVDCPLRGQRPFICEGYPTKCHAVIIGTNPASPLNMNWWEFWTSDYGFDYNLFMCKYKARRGKPGPTRQRLMRITECLREVRLKCVETNVYRREAKSEEQLWEYDVPNRHPNDEVLHLLIEGLQPPKAIVPHGRVARDWLIVQGHKLPPDVRILDRDRQIQHLSKGSDRDDDITYVCDWIKSLLGENR